MGVIDQFRQVRDEAFDVLDKVFDKGIRRLHPEQQPRLPGDLPETAEHRVTQLQFHPQALIKRSLGQMRQQSPRGFVCYGQARRRAKQQQSVFGGVRHFGYPAFAWLDVWRRGLIFGLTRMSFGIFSPASGSPVVNHDQRVAAQNALISLVGGASLQVKKRSGNTFNSWRIGISFGSFPGLTPRSGWLSKPSACSTMAGIGPSRPVSFSCQKSP